MFSGPMFRWERQVVSRGRRPFVVRTIFAAVLAAVALLIGVALSAAPAADDRTRQVYLGQSLLVAAIGFELLALVFFVPAYVAGAIAGEREKDTLPLLLLTRLTPLEIVLTKVAARWVSAFHLVLAGLPVLVAGAWLADLEFEGALALLVLTTTSAFMASLAILASARPEQVSAARGAATGTLFGWLVGPPVVSILPVASGSFWGDLLVELKGLCALVAPSSPLSLLTDRAWYFRSTAVTLEERVALMVGLQAAFGLAAVALASGRLKAREKNPNWLDPTRGHRPACGDDPIFWREFELPIRQGSGPLLLVRLRYAWILVRAVLINLLGLVGVALAVAVPIGLLVSTIYYGQAAFRELWEHGHGGAGTFGARSYFNLLIRAGTGLLAFLPALGAGVLVAGRIVTERDKKTWDAFLTTPLSGAEILRSKARVAVRGLWYSARPLPALWVLGLACGVVAPLGVALAAVDLALVAWANIALGLYLALRPGPTAAASSRAAMSQLAFFALHTPLLHAALASPRELAAAGAWDPRLWWALAFAGLAIPTLTGLLAWTLTRRTLRRFDEWAGRPIPADAPKAKPPLVPEPAPA